MRLWKIRRWLWDTQKKLQDARRNIRIKIQRWLWNVRIELKEMSYFFRHNKVFDWLWDKWYKFRYLKSTIMIIPHIESKKPRTYYIPINFAIFLSIVTIGLILTIIIILLFKKPANMPYDQVSKTKQLLSQLDKNFEALHESIKKEKYSIEELSEKKKNLENIIRDSDKINKIFINQEKLIYKINWRNIIIAYVIGIFSSITATFIKNKIIIKKSSNK